MKTAGWLSLLLAGVASGGLAASFVLTRRHYLSAHHLPSEYGLAAEAVSFQAIDGVKLHGWWIPAPGARRAVIILHGHGGSMDWDVFRAPPLLAAGFSVLLFDLRAHGRSEGQAITFGHLEQRDVVGAVAFLRSRGIRSIGVLGFSLGGMTAIHAAADCADIAAVISDGGPARMRTALTVWGMEKGLPRWLAAPLAWLALVGTSLRLGMNLFGREPIHKVGRIAPRPILFIHGDQDQYLPDFDALYAAARPPKELWREPQAGHTTVSQLYPEAYTRRVVAYFDQVLDDSV